MPVFVDEQSLPAQELGLTTVGEVLTHLRNDNRLVVSLLIDGKQPCEIGPVRRSPVTNKTLYIETARSADIARQAIDEAQEQLGRTDPLRLGAAEMLEKNQISGAMDKLGAYFNLWQSVHESALKICQLLQLDLERTIVNSESIADRLAAFTAQLRQITQTLINRDFVSLTDQLLYEAPQTCRDWLDLLAELREMRALSNPENS